ncbi:uncharacterized protein Dana_GF28026, partial [Drosophila ananassae]
MNTYIIFSILILFLQTSLSAPPKEDEFPTECKAVCFNAVKPFLTYLDILQKRVEVCEVTVAGDTLSQIAVLNGTLEILGKKLAIQEEKEKDSETKIMKLEQLLASGAKNIPNLKSEPFQKVGSKYYYIEEKLRQTWHGSLQVCHKLGAHLVSLQSQEEIEAISGLLREYAGYWIDVTDQFKDGEYISISTGWNASFLNWAKNEPSHGQEHCVELHTYEGPAVMNDNLCSAKKFFICESNALEE